MPALSNSIKPAVAAQQTMSSEHWMFRPAWENAKCHQTQVPQCIWKLQVGSKSHGSTVGFILPTYLHLSIWPGWWLTYPSEKYDSQWEGLSHILWKTKNVPNHQPVTSSFWQCFLALTAHTWGKKVSKRHSKS
jgi:hypothetical protein